MIETRTSHRDDLFGIGMRRVTGQEPKLRVDLPRTNRTGSFPNVRALSNPKVSRKMRTVPLHGALDIKVGTSSNDGRILKQRIHLEFDAANMHHVQEIQNPFQDAGFNGSAKMSHPLCVHLPNETVLGCVIVHHRLQSGSLLERRRTDLSQLNFAKRPPFLKFLCKN
jgi:hypothetical protein